VCVCVCVCVYIYIYIFIHMLYCSMNDFSFVKDIIDLMFVPCIAGLCIENQHCALGFVNFLLLMWLLHVSAPTCHPRGASLSS
jgi:hypothetical protein